MPGFSFMGYSDSPFTEGEVEIDLYNGFQPMAAPEAWAATAGG